MPQKRGERKRTQSFMNWRNYFRFRRPLPVNWIRLRSSGWQPATWKWWRFFQMVSHFCIANLSCTICICVLSIFSRSNWSHQTFPPLGSSIRHGPAWLCSLCYIVYTSPYPHEIKYLKKYVNIRINLCIKQFKNYNITHNTAFMNANCQTVITPKDAK